MSKTSVGDVYAKVIKEVCELSRVDFEEGGTELATLDLMQLEWQKKLSQLKIGQMPWDPTPTPAKETALTSNVKTSSQSAANSSNSNQSAPVAQPGPPVPAVKHEGRSYPQQAQLQQTYPVPSFSQGQMTAQQRAAMALHQTYGERAGAQIAELQQSGQPRSTVPASIPPSQPQDFVKQEDSKPSLAELSEFTNDIPQQTSVPIKSSQTDGAGEWEKEVDRRQQVTFQSRQNNDRLMLQQFLSTQAQLEGGGLLLPLDERTARPDLKQKVANLNASLPSSSNIPSITRAQGDAAGDDDDDDDEGEDAINSDLDDPDDLGDNDQDSENTNQMMLCTWDKVQRVKNKWKCTLKDGILRVEGTEYVFHKGQGEFEW